MTATAWAKALVQAHRDQSLIPDLARGWLPTEDATAYAVQDETLRLLGDHIAGWKAGAKSPDGAVFGSLLPAQGVVASPACLPLARHRPFGLELEIAFRLGRAFEPRVQPYAEAEVMAALAEVLATLEVVSSRYAAWPDLDPLAVRADLQCHGALVVGEARPYRPDLPWLRPPASLCFNGNELLNNQPAANPIGDPRRVLPWVVNHCTGRGRRFEPGMVITAGSYTGLALCTEPGEVVGEIAGLPPVRLTIT